MFKKYHLSYFNRLISLQMYVLCIYIILEGTKICCWSVVGAWQRVMGGRRWAGHKYFSVFAPLNSHVPTNFRQI